MLAVAALQHSALYPMCKHAQLTVPANGFPRGQAVTVISASLKGARLQGAELNIQR